jgi:DNA primase
MAERMHVTIGGHRIEITNPDKVLFPDDGTTASDLVRYHERVAGVMLRHLRGRPVMLQRFPDGITKQGFLQKDASDHFPDWVRRVVAGDPDRLTVEQRKAKRHGRVFIDTLRNAYAQTAVAPYSVRPRPGAPVATPLEWNELSARGLEPQRYRAATIPRRLARRNDPWALIDRRSRSLARARRGLDRSHPAA